MKEINAQIWKNILILAGILIFTNLNGQHLKQHQWKHRVLIIQTSEESSEKYQNQLQEFADSEKTLKDRKIVIYQIVGEKYKMTNYAHEKRDNSWQNAKALAIDELEESDAFRVMLIGLDGGIKMKKTSVLKKQELFGKIDSMPMRMQELRNRERRNEIKHE